MSYGRFEIIDHSPPSFFSETISLTPFFPPSLAMHNEDLTFATLDLLNPKPNSAFSLLDFPSPFDSFTDVVQIETTPYCSYKRLLHRRRVNSQPELYLQALCDRVSSLESKFDRLLQVKERKEKLREVDRKYSWTAEIKGGVERKYKWTAEIEGDDTKKGKIGERKYQWVTEIKGKKDDEKKTYTWKATIGGEKNKEKKKKKDEKGSSGTRIVEIEEPSDPSHRDVVLRQAFAKRSANDKGKKKELSPLDAAVLIQMSFRAYLIRRSQALRALRELAVAKTKLKELRELFQNFSYRKRVASDAEERQKFSEKIIVLLLTVDAIEGVDQMVRAAKRSMVDELEAMLDAVDPQPGVRSLSMRRRTFDMPSGTIQKEISEGVAQVVELLGQENGTFEACL